MKGGGKERESVEETRKEEERGKRREGEEGMEREEGEELGKTGRGREGGIGGGVALDDAMVSEQAEKKAA